VKFSAVIADIFGKSGRDMLAALIAGSATRRRWQPRPAARCAQNERLQEALTGHHAFLLAMTLSRTDAPTA